MRGTDLADELGVTYRQIHHWTKQGLLIPEGGTLPQGGVALRFNDKETKIVRITARLVQYGMKPAFAAHIARSHVEQGSGVTIFDLDGVGHLHVTA